MGWLMFARGVRGGEMGVALMSASAHRGPLCLSASGRTGSAPPFTLSTLHLALFVKLRVSHSNEKRGEAVAGKKHPKGRVGGEKPPELVQLQVSRSTQNLDIRLSVDRVFNAAKHGKTRNSPSGRRLPPRISGMNGRIENSEQMPHI